MHHWGRLRDTVSKCFSLGTGPGKPGMGALCPARASTPFQSSPIASLTHLSLLWSTAPVVTGTGPNFSLGELQGHLAYDLNPSSTGMRRTLPSTSSSGYVLAGPGGDGTEGVEKLGQVWAWLGWFGPSLEPACASQHGKAQPYAYPQLVHGACMRVM